MTYLQFESLTPFNQFEILTEKGVMIGNRVCAAHKFLLYQIDSFYVELKYDLIGTKLEATKCFFDIKDLEQYLGDISLPEQ